VKENEMYQEYLIGKELNHPNITQYKYFVKEVNMKKN